MKKLKPLSILLVLISSLLLTNCSTSEDDPNNNPPGLFSANSTDIKFYSATIVWTESLDFDDDPVTYSVYLEGMKVASSLELFTFTFSGLEPETLYEGYVESNDGKGGTNKADFFFTTKQKVIILSLPIIVKEFTTPIPSPSPCPSSLEIDAGVLVPKYEGNVTYNLSFSTLTLNNGNSTVAAVSRTWTNTSFDSYYIYDVDATNFFVWQAGAGMCTTNTTAISTTRALYASASGTAQVTITFN